MKFDTERVILEVHQRPLLWDKSNELYKNKDARDAAWKDILKEIAPNYESLSEEEKKDADKKIQQRWRTARDTFQKEKVSEKNQPCSSESKKKKKYSFYDMLTFLDNTTQTEANETLTKPQPEDSNLESANMDTQPGTSTQNNPQQYNNQQLTQSSKQEKQPKRKNQIIRDNCEFETQLLQFLRSSDLEVENDDLAFFKSIQPIINGFTSYQKLMFRTKVLNVLMEMENQIQSPNYSLPSTKVEFNKT